MKVVLTRTWAGFRLSEAASKRLLEKGVRYAHTRSFRCNPAIIEVIESMGEAAFGKWAKLEVVDIPFDTEEGWYIDSRQEGEVVVGYRTTNNPTPNQRL